MANTFIHTRRSFLQHSVSLAIGIPFLSSCWSSGEGATLQQTIERNIDPSQIQAWLEILQDGSIRIFTGKMELGQGIRTAVAQIAADELYTEINKIEVFTAETEVSPDEAFTVGSNSIETSAMSIRYAAATAREKLLQLASNKMTTSIANLRITDARVIHTDGRSISFFELLEGKQLTELVNKSIKLKPQKEYQWVGKAVPRKEVEMILRGEQVFIQDLRFDGMLHARVVRPPSYEASLTPIDQDILLDQLDGIDRLLVDGSFVGIIAEDEYEAIKAQAFLQKQLQWSNSKPLSIPQNLGDFIDSIAGEKENVISKGNSKPTSADRISGTYLKPYIMHGSIGPSCAVAIYTNHELKIWTHSQGVYPLRRAISKLVGLSEKLIHIKGVPGSGCYGHNGADDAAADVALLALAYPDKHIRLQWSRADEHGWEPYGSAMRMSLQASLNPKGKIVSWEGEIASDSHSARARAAGDLLAAAYIKHAFTRQASPWKGGTHRNAEPYYDIANIKIDIRSFVGPLRTSALRSLGAYANIFALESFMDELAEKAQIDPVDFRIMHSTDERSIAVLEKIRTLTQKKHLQKGEGIGYGFSRYENYATYCAVAAKVSIQTTGKIKIHSLWAVVDAGEAINPDGLKNQTEGGMLQAASWTLMEKVQHDETHVSSLNWTRYPILRFKDVPQVVVEIIDRPNESPLGAGEAAQGPTSAAIANAVYAACGKRVRELPINIAL